MNDFASSNLDGGSPQLLEDRLKGVQTIIGDAGHHESEPESAEIIFAFPACGQPSRIRQIDLAQNSVADDLCWCANRSRLRFVLRGPEKLFSSGREHTRLALYVRRIRNGPTGPWPVQGTG